MRKRDRARQWEVEWEDAHSADGADVCYDWRYGDNRREGNRLSKVEIGEWFKAKLLKGKTKRSKERYKVKFGDRSYVFYLNKNGTPVIRLQWADSFVEAKPENIGQLTNSTANAKKKRRGK